MPSPDLPAEFLKRLRTVKAKRPKTVIQHILKHGFITTEELASKYGYNHPPRAARDVREQGIPLETIRVKNADGRTIAAYKFADPSKVIAGRLGGRRTFSKEFKTVLVELCDSRCHICLDRHEERYLQVDHRVPYEVAGDAVRSADPQDFMLLCGSCNRAKSWSCEHCENWTEGRSVVVCQGCYWARPETYTHMAMREVRRTDVVWSGVEIDEFDRLKAEADSVPTSLPEHVKSVIRKHLTNRKHRG